MRPAKQWRSAEVTWREVERWFDPRERAMRVLGGGGPSYFYDGVCVVCGALCYGGSGASAWHADADDCQLSMTESNIGLCVALACRALCGDL